MPRKSSEEREAAREREQRAATEDARNMLLACGVDPDDPKAREAFGSLLFGNGADEPLVYTVQQFCALAHMSRSRFYRHKKEGTAPEMGTLFGEPRISKEAARRWLARYFKPEEPDAAERAIEAFRQRQQQAPAIVQALGARRRKTAQGEPAPSIWKRARRAGSKGDAS